MAWIFLLIPSIAYLFTAWKIKIENLKGVFDEETYKLYFKKFFPAEDVSSENDLRKRFNKILYRNHGRRHYILPLILLGAISGIGLILTASSLLYWLDLNPKLKPLPPIAISAFLGAYMWVAFDQIQRYRIMDFTAHDVYRCSFRFLIAIPLGFSFAATVVEPIGIPLAFFLGTFPMKTLVTYGKRFVTQKLGIGEQRDEPKSELEQLQSIGRIEAERYHEEGKTNILQLAYSDPVDLTLRTNFDFNYVIDCISQALLWLYIGNNIDKLRPLGMRGAYEAATLYSMLNSTDPKEKNIADENLKEIVKALDINERAFQITLLNVAEDPYTKFICDIWC